MAEPYEIILTKGTNYDGGSPITTTRANLQTTGGRVFTGTVPDPGGVFAADIFGLFSPEATKLVGIAASSDNPRNAARVLSTDDSPSNQINLTRAFQYLLLHGSERLSVITNDPRPTQLRLVVNELSEKDHMAWASRQRPSFPHVRYRFIRQVPFTFSAGDPLWVPNFSWDGSSATNFTTDSTNGLIRISTLSPWENEYGCLVSIRYSGSAAVSAKFNVVNLKNRGSWVAQSNIPDMRWSRVQYLRDDDLIGLEAQSAAGLELVCDIELVRVEPGDRLLGRYTTRGNNAGLNL